MRRGYVVRGYKKRDVSNLKFLLLKVIHVLYLQKSEINSSVPSKQ